MDRSSVNTATQRTVNMTQIFTMAKDVVEMMGDVDETKFHILAANVAYFMGKNKKSYMESMLKWPECVGGLITEESVNAYEQFAKEVQNHYALPEKFTSYKQSDIEGIDKIKDKVIANLNVCTLKDDNPLVTINKLSYSFSRKELNNLIFSVSNDDGYELKTYADQIDISGKIKTALVIWALKKQVESLANPDPMIKLYIERLKNYNKEFYKRLIK